MSGYERLLGLLGELANRPDREHPKPIREDPKPIHEHPKPIHELPKPVPELPRGYATGVVLRSAPKDRGIGNGENGGLAWLALKGLRRV